MNTDGYDISELRKYLRVLREEAQQNNVPIRIVVDDDTENQDSMLFWSKTYIHSEIDDLKQMQCDGGVESYEIRIISDHKETISEINSDIDYDKIYLYH